MPGTMPQYWPTGSGRDSIVFRDPVVVFGRQGQKNEPRQYGGGANPPSPATWVNNQIRRWKQAEEHQYKPVYVDEPVRPPTAPTQGHSARATDSRLQQAHAAVCTAQGVCTAQDGLVSQRSKKPLANLADISARPMGPVHSAPYLMHHIAAPIAPPITQTHPTARKMKRFPETHVEPMRDLVIHRELPHAGALPKDGLAFHVDWPASFTKGHAGTQPTAGDFYPAPLSQRGAARSGVNAPRVLRLKKVKKTLAEPLRLTDEVRPQLPIPKEYTSQTHRSHSDMVMPVSVRGGDSRIQPGLQMISGPPPRRSTLLTPVLENRM